MLSTHERALHSMDTNFFDNLVGWTTIGQFVLALIALILQIRTSGVTFGDAIHRIFPWIAGGLTLTLPYYLAFRASIFLATTSPGTTETLVVRATGWAIFLGIVWGFLWTMFIFQRLFRLRG